MTFSQSSKPIKPLSDKKKKVFARFVVLEEGEFLYDESTLKLYTCSNPHKYVGKFDLQNDKIIKN